MKTAKRSFGFILALLMLFILAALTVPAVMAAQYEDGSYQVPFSVDGLGRHNIAWPTATVHVRGEVLTVDFTFERVDPRDHAPSYDWIETSCGTFYPVIDDANYTCSFYDVQVEALGAVNVSVQSSAMSQPYTIEYTLQIDGSSITLKSGSEEASQGQSSAPSSDPKESSGAAESDLPSPAPEPDGLGSGAIAAIVAGSVVLIGGAVYLIIRKKH